MKKSVVLIAPVWGLLVLSLLGVAGCGSEENSNPMDAGTGGTGGTRASEPATTIARIAITPAAVVLTEAGKTYQLTAQGYNAADQAIDADFTWTSSDPAEVEVGSMGLVEAMVSIGSAQITAEAQGVTSSPAVVTLARPVAGAVFVSDDQVVEGPSFAGEPADFGMGSLIQLTLEGIGAPKVGDILLPQETLSVGGRVAAVEETSPGAFLVSLEVIPLSEMYEEFAINERFPLTVDETMVTERVAELYDVEQRADGGMARKKWTVNTCDQAARAKPVKAS